MSSQAFDPYTAFELFNHDHGKMTCVGYAPSQRRRCRNPAKGKYSDSLQNRLQGLLDEDPFNLHVETILRALAAGSLCTRYHQNQADRIYSGWIAQVHDHVAGANSAPVASVASTRTTSIVNRTTTRTNETATTNPTARAATGIQANQTAIAATTPGPTQSAQSTPTTTPADCVLSHVSRRSTDDDCAICMEECRNTPLSELVWCKASCGRSVHSTCFQQWRTERAYHTPLRCVFCRATWSRSCIHDEVAPRFVGIWNDEDLGLERLFRLP